MHLSSILSAKFTGAKKKQYFIQKEVKMKKTYILKKIIILALTLSLLTSCSNKNKNISQKNGTGENTVKITATFYPLYIMLMNLTENVSGTEIAMLAPSNTGCLHDYTLSTRDMKKINSSDIIVVNGAGMEDFIDKILSVKEGRIITAAKDIPLIEENPHVWVSPVNYILMLKNITDGLKEIDKKNASLYQENYLTYSKKISDLVLDMHTQLKDIKGKKVITFHEAFPYFVNEFNLDCVQVIERETGQAPSAKELNNLISLIREEITAESKPALFAEPQYSSSAAQIIAKETGLKVYMLDPAVNGKIDKDAYIDAMKQNTKILKEAFN